LFCDLFFIEVYGKSFYFPLNVGVNLFRDMVWRCDGCE